MTKKIISFLLSVLLCIGCVSTLCYAENGPTVSVGTTSGKVGDSVEIPVILSGNSGFSSLGIEISYDNTVLKLTNVVGNTTTGANYTGASDYSVKPYNMSFISSANTVYNGTLATMTFEIISDVAGDYPITVSYYKGRNGNYTDGDDVNYDADWMPLGLTYVNGKVNIETVKPVEPVTISIANASGKKGDTVEIPVTLANNTGFASLGIEISYDSSALKLTNVVGNTSTGANYTSASDYSVMPYNISFISSSDTTFNGTLATLTFEIISSEDGIFPISADYYKGRNGDYINGEDVNYNSDWEPVIFTYSDGNVTVTGSKSEETIKISEVKISFNVKLSAPEKGGQVMAALYDDFDKLIETKMYTPEENVKIEFNKFGSYIKVMWWDNIKHMKPLSKSQRINLK